MIPSKVLLGSSHFEVLCIGESRKAKSRMDWEKLGIDIEKHRFGSLPECFQIKEKERTDVHQAMHYCKEETKQVC